MTTFPYPYMNGYLHLGKSRPKVRAQFDGLFLFLSKALIFTA